MKYVSHLITISLILSLLGFLVFIPEGNLLGGNTPAPMYLTAIPGCFGIYSLVNRWMLSTEILVSLALIVVFCAFHLYLYLPKLPNDVRDAESRHETFNQVEEG